MADVIIRGMDMPLRCINCPFKTYYHGTSRCLANRGKPIEWEIGNDRGRDCPLLPLPEGHGRLIDADALIIDSGINTFAACFAVANAPTIVPAEGATDDAN